MKFICLKYLDQNSWEATSEAARRGFREACLEYDAQLRACGHFFATEALHTAGAGVGVRSSNGQLLINDLVDRFTEPALLSGLMFLEARDLNHVLVLVADHPGVRIGWFEIHAADAGSLS